jgi:hypothetical protein
MQEKKSFNILTKAFAAIEKDLNILMEKAYESEKK